LKDVTDKVAKAWNITGPFNMQIIKNDVETNPDHPELKVIECNIRASRSFPFVSKVLGTNFINVAVQAILGQKVEPVNLMDVKRDYVATKVPQFSFTRLAGADPFLGVEMASTGEIASFGKDTIEAYWTALQSTMNFHLPLPPSGLLFGGDVTKEYLGEVAQIISPIGYKYYTASEEVAAYLRERVPDYLVEVIEFPTTDKRALREVFQKYDIKGVFNLASARAESLLDQDYVMRRNAIDFGIPLFNEPQTSLLFANALKAKIHTKLSQKEGEVVIPAEVRRWSEFIGGKPV
jgi:carbamoyl-phosphate synthase large subunit